MAASRGRKNGIALLCALGWAALPPAQPARADASAPGEAQRATKPAPTARETLMRCAREWEDRKRSGEAGASTWRRFWAECQKR